MHQRQLDLFCATLQKELRLSSEIRQDLKLARRAYLTQLGFIVRERQELIRSFQENMPDTGNHSAASTRQAAPSVVCVQLPLFVHLTSELCRGFPQLSKFLPGYECMPCASVLQIA